MSANLHFLKHRLRFIGNPSKNDIFLTPLIIIFRVIPCLCWIPKYETYQRKMKKTYFCSMIYTETNGR